MRVLFVFAHQDDEYGVAPWIAQEIAAGADVRFVYLTDGAARTPPEVRDAESLRALERLGVARESVAFLTTPSGRIADGALHARPLEAVESVERWMKETGFVPDRLYAPAYEGGHPDHDTAHLIAALLAERAGIRDDAWHFSLYNAYRCTRPFFNSLKQLPSASAARPNASGFATRWRHAMLCWSYASQRRTWIGLFPGAFLERVVAGREKVIRFDPARLGERPHDGELLYERLFGTTFEQWLEGVRPLLERYRREREAPTA